MKDISSLISSQDSTALVWENQQQVAQEKPAQVRERTLMLRAKNGDAEAFYDLVHPYQRGVFLTALAILNNQADAADVAQEAMLKAFRSLASFRGEAKFSTWLFQIAINESRMKLRKDRRHLYDSLEEGPINEDGEYIPMEFADWRHIPSDALEQKELREALTKALHNLGEKYRAVLILRDIQGLNIQETAVALDLSEATVKTRLSRARLQMRDALAPIAFNRRILGRQD